MLGIPKFFLRYAKPIFILALVSPIFGAMYGILIPWPIAQGELGKFPGQTPVMIQFSYHGGTGGSIREQTYLLFPSVFSEPKSVTIRRQNDGPPEVAINSWGLAQFLINYALALAITGWVLRRSRRELAEK